MECRTRKSESSHLLGLIGLVGLLLGLGVLFSPGPAQAAHKLKENTCGDCHSVSGAPGRVVPYTKLIKKNDLRIAEIQGASGVLAPWTGGNELPCIYCHQDDTGTRTHMIGVKGHFSAANLAKHDWPANTYLVSSNNGALDAQLDCVDCHKSVEYVGKGTIGDQQNPNIHSKDTLNVAWTGAVAGTTGLLLVNQTFQASPYNSVGNSLCRTRCHNGVSLLPTKPPLLHGYARTTVSLEGKNGFTTTVGGCLYNGARNTGCHGTHGSSGTDLITLQMTGGGLVGRDDCGACHKFDDDRLDLVNHSNSPYERKGHGHVNVVCVECHDSKAAHFDGITGKPLPGNRLFSADPQLSTFSSPRLPLLSNCLKCHSGKSAHFRGGVDVGCLDCHDPHGPAVGANNIAMVRGSVPIRTPTRNIVLTTAGDYWTSTTPRGVYSNKICDNPDCHGQPGGPGPFSTRMAASTNTPHTGGTSKANYSCNYCHVHNDTTGSMRAGDSCSGCHGNALNKTNWPQRVVGAAYFNRDGSHSIHVAFLGGNLSCSYCHPQGKHTGNFLAPPATVCNDGSNATSFKNMIPAKDLDGVFNSTTKVCSKIDCHQQGATPSWYGTSSLACGGCHAIPPATGSHPKHANSNADHSECYRCHGDNAAGGGYSSTPSGNHILNGKVDLPAGWWHDKTAPAGTVRCATFPVCHSSNPADIAYWGSPKSVSCDACHYFAAAGAISGSGNANHFAPLSTAHSKHFDTIARKFCTACHGPVLPVNNSHISFKAGTDGAVLADRSIAARREAAVARTNMTWNTTSRTCSGTGLQLSCHATQATPSWGGTIGPASCVKCHTDKTTATLNGTTGLHRSSYALTVKAHDENLVGGCIACHVKNTIYTHWNGVLNGRGSSLGFPAAWAYSDRIAASSVATTLQGTCYGAGLAAPNCHLDNGRWARQWSKAALSLSTNLGAKRCAVCHGDFANGWRITATPASSRSLSEHRKANIADTTKHGGCSICHVYPAAPYAWTNHNNNLLAVNVNNTVKYNGTTNACDGLICHGNAVPAYAVTGGGFALEKLNGPQATCADCHGNKATHQYWPQGSGGIPSYADSWPGSAARHKTHIWAITQYKWSATPAGVLNRANYDASQKAVCQFCHGTTPGRLGHTADRGDHRAPVGSQNLFRKFTGGQADAVDANATVFSPTTFVCYNLVCHNLQNTPATAGSNWRGTTGYNPPSTQAECQTLCHKVEYAIPHKTGHARHVSVKGYACERCHPNHISPSVDFRHLSGQVGVANTTMNAIRNPGGYAGYVGTYTAAVAGQVANFSGTGQCVGLYCHGRVKSARWSSVYTANQCTACHTAGGGQTSDPVSGLHKSAFAITVKGHDQNLFASTIGGAGNGCVACHTLSPNARGAANHVDGFMSTKYVSATAGVAIYGSVVPSAGLTVGCATKGVRYQTCHSDQGNWTRDWDIAANSQSTNATAVRCRVCHGVWGYWNAGTSHYRNDGLAANSRANTQGQVYHTTANCDDCHAYVTVPNQHDTAVHLVQVNNNGTGFTVTAGQTRCNLCHAVSDVQHTFPTSLAFAFSRVNGPAIVTNCTDCHGNKATHQYWPQGSGGIPSYADSWPGSAARHKTHIWAITQYKWSATPAGVLNRANYDASQKAVCQFCHGTTPGRLGHTADRGDHRAPVGSQNLFRKFTGGQADAVDANATVFSPTTFVCYNLVCHNLQNTPATAGSNWRGTTGYNPPSTQAECQVLCHKVEYAIPHKTGHARHVSVKGYACERCHPNHISPSVDFRHLSGQVGVANTTMNAIRNPGGYAGYVGTYTAAVAGQVANFSGTGQCVGLYCHGRVKSARWGSVYTANQCTACHTAGGSQTSDPVSGLHKSAFAITVKGHDQNLFASTIGGAGNGCVACHTLSPNARGAANHVDGFMSTKYVSATAGVAIYGSVVPSAGLTVGCATKGVRYQTCHSDQGNWTRDWDIAANSQSTNATAVRCRVCHGVWGYWNAGTSHYRNDGLAANSRANTQGQVYHTTANCDDCHAYVTVPNQHDTAVHLVQVNNNGTGFTSGQGGVQARCDLCHAVSDVQHTFPTSLAFAFSRVNGPAIATNCTDCHGNKATHQYWPQGSGGIPSYADSWPGSAARHKTHIWAITQYKWSATPAGMLNRANYDASQKYVCQFCHGTTPGRSGHTADRGDHRAPVGSTNLFRKFTGGQADAVDGNGTSFSPTTFVCYNLVCHNLQNTPATAGSNWRGTTGYNPPSTQAECQVLCHKVEYAIPHKTGHARHVSVKGYACERCHPNHISPSTDFRHLSGQVGVANTTMNAIRNPGGYAGYVGTYTAAVAGQVANFSGTGQCVGLYCHGRVKSARWGSVYTANQCTACHTAVGGTQTTDPVSGLHRIGTAGVTGHDDRFALAGTRAPAFGASGDCTTCHTVVPNALGAPAHVNGWFSAHAIAANNGPTMAASVGLSAYWVTSTTAETCAPSAGRFVNCHLDRGRWTRQWSTASDSASSVYGAPRCAVCHGDFGSGWRITAGTVGGRTLSEHRKPNIAATGNHHGCATCHAYVDPSYNWATRHNNGAVAVNVNASVAYTSVGNVCNGGVCHGNAIPAYAVTGVQANPFPLERLVGPPASCADCHGNRATHQYWPRGSGGIPSYADSWPGSAARHKTHIWAITQYKWSATPAGVLNRANYDASQKYVCQFCHGTTPGRSGHTVDRGDHRAPVGSTNLFRKFTGGQADAVDANATVFSPTTFVCYNLVCHNLQNTPATAGSNWRGTTGYNPPSTQAECQVLCHKVEYAIPHKTGHARHVSVKGYACERCHPNHISPSTDFRHLSGQVGVANTTMNAIRNPGGYAGYVGTYTAAVAGQVANFSGTGQCVGLYCHGRVKSARWGSVYTANQCTACHTAVGGTQTTDPVSGLHRIGTAGVMGHDDRFALAGTRAPAFGASGDCTTCHTVVPNALGAPAHVNGWFSAHAIAANNGPTMAASVGLSAYWVTSTTAETCAPSAGRFVNCHLDRGRWTRQWSTASDSASSVYGAPRCAVCHGDFGSGWRITAGTAGGRALSDHRRAKVQSTGNHDRCRMCHVYSDGTYNWATRHNNGAVAVNIDPTIAYNGTTGACDGLGCHGNAVPAYAMTHVQVNRFPLERIDGPAGNCKICHDSSGLTHLDANESTASHNTLHASGAYITGCMDCHPNAGGGAGTGHQDGAVAFSNMLAGMASYKASPGSYAGTNCSSKTKCHDSAAGDWKAATMGTDSCVQCHLAVGKSYSFAVPYSGLHVVSVSGVAAHDKGLFRSTMGRPGCVTCHGPIPSSTHLNGVFNPAAANFAGSVNQQLFVVRTCAPAGVRYQSCHSDQGAWYRRWDAAANSASTAPGSARCNVCHGQWGGWIVGTSHYRHNSTQPGRASTAGRIQHETSANCNECHTYGSAPALARHRDNYVTMNNNGGAATVVGTAVYCTPCHTNKQPYSFPKSNAFPMRSFMGSLQYKGCAVCHALVPATGAHTRHLLAPPAGPGLDCAACHGPNPGGGGSNTWHNAFARSGYNPNTEFANIALSATLTTTQRGTENAYYLTTWSRSGATVPATVTKAANYRFACTNVYCHGMLAVNWTWKGWEPAALSPSYSSTAGFQTCGGCHGMGSDGPNHRIYTASFRGRSGTRYQATSTAANYARPLSGFSRGGHGDLGIKAQVPFVNSAPTREVPVSCGGCHSQATDHFPTAANNPYRMSTLALSNGLPGADAKLTRISNLCSQTNCHPKTSVSTYGVFEPSAGDAHRHGSDHYPISGTAVYYIMSTSKPIIRKGTSNNVAPRYNPIDLGAGGHTPVGFDIDRYVDDWQWWGNPATTNDTGDGHPFLPLGDSLLKGGVGGTDYNNMAGLANSANSKVTCITCHNPHGTDLYVLGQNPGAGSSFMVIPDNKMLRLRYEEDASDQICYACH